jgi:hypothetical protein
MKRCAGSPGESRPLAGPQVSARWSRVRCIVQRAMRRIDRQAQTSTSRAVDQRTRVRCTVVMYRVSAQAKAGSAPATRGRTYGARGPKLACRSSPLPCRSFDHRAGLRTYILRHSWKTDVRVDRFGPGWAGMSPTSRAGRTAQPLRCSKLALPATRPPHRSGRGAMPEERTGQSALFERGPGGPDFAGPFSIPAASICGTARPGALPSAITKVSRCSSWPSTLSGFLVSLGKVVQGLLLGHEASPLVCHTSAGSPPLRLGHMRGPVPIVHARLEPFCNAVFVRLVGSLRRRRWQYRGFWRLATFGGGSGVCGAALVGSKALQIVTTQQGILALWLND